MSPKRGSAAVPASSPGSPQGTGKAAAKGEQSHKAAIEAAYVGGGTLCDAAEAEPSAAGAAFSYATKTCFTATAAVSRPSEVVR